MLRTDVLLAFNDGWQPPTAAEFDQVFNELGMSVKQLCIYLGYKDSKSVWRFRNGAAVVPYSYWRRMLAKAGYITMAEAINQ